MCVRAATACGPSVSNINPYFVFIGVTDRAITVKATKVAHPAAIRVGDSDEGDGRLSLHEYLCISGVTCRPVSVRHHPQEGARAQMNDSRA